MNKPYPANQQVFELFDKVKQQYHPGLAEARIAVALVDAKPFIKNKFNFGKISKFSDAHQIWHPENRSYQFLSTLVLDVWNDILDNHQREALADLHLECCKIEYEPVTVEVNGKKKVVKDEYGCVEYTNVFKLDKDGEKIYKVEKIDIQILSANIKRYGLWLEDFVEFANVLKEKNIQ